MQESYDAVLLPTTERLVEAVKLINRIPAETLKQLLNRLQDSFSYLEKQEKATEKGSISSKPGNQVLNSSELSNLQAVLGFDSVKQVSDVVEACLFLVDRFLFESCTSTQVKDHLEMSSLDISPLHIKIFTEFWEVFISTNVVSQLQGEVLGPRRLEMIRWSLSLNLATTSVFHQKDPCVTLDIDVNSRLCERSTGQKETETLTLEFSQKELSRFFSDIEVIQRQLDEISQSNNTG
mmetsp:Transcript_689/g.722  ORF Transcript_689/g.722 Transcript_689/m.722 type:complete len:236 (+) Transcript_689:310-1017(+)